MNASSAARAPIVSVHARMACTALSPAALRSRSSFAVKARRRGGRTSWMRSAENAAAADFLTASAGSLSASSSASVAAVTSDARVSAPVIASTSRSTASALRRASSASWPHARSTRARPGRAPARVDSHGSAATSAAASDASPGAAGPPVASSNSGNSPSSSAACSGPHPPCSLTSAARTIDAASSCATALFDPSAGGSDAAAAALSARLASPSPPPSPAARPSCPTSRPVEMSACVSVSLAVLSSDEAATAAVFNHRDRRTAPTFSSSSPPSPLPSPSPAAPTIPSSPPCTASNGAQSFHAPASAGDHASASPPVATRSMRRDASLAASLGAAHATGHHPPTASVTAFRWGTARHSALWSTTASLAVIASRQSAASAWRRVGASPSFSATVASRPGAIRSGEHDGGMPSTRVNAAWRSAMHAASRGRFGVEGVHRDARAAPTRAAHSSPAPRGDGASNHATIRRAIFLDLAVASIPPATPPAGRTMCSSIGSTTGYAVTARASSTAATSAPRKAAISSRASASSRAIFVAVLPPPPDAPRSPPAARRSIARRSALGSWHPSTTLRAGPSRFKGSTRCAASSMAPRLWLHHRRSLIVFWSEFSESSQLDALGMRKPAFGRAPLTDAPI